MQTPKTWTGLPDIEDAAPRVCTIEQEQEEYLIEHLGAVMYAKLQEMENAPRT